LLSILLLLIGSVFWIYTTQSGLKWAWDRVDTYLPEGFSVGEVRGQLNDEITLLDSVWKQPDLLVQISRINIKCDWMDLIFGQLHCSQLKVLSVKSSTTIKNQTTDNNLATLELPQISIPLDIALSLIEINEMTYTSFSEDGQTLTNEKISNLRINDSKYQQLTFYISQLTLSTSEQQLNLSGHLSPYGDWQHQLELITSGSEYNLSFSSYGKIKQRAFFILNTEKPIKTKTAGNWYWDKGLFLEKAHSTAPSQLVELQQHQFDLDELQADFELSWPTLKSDSSIKASWQQYRGVIFKTNLTISDISNWKLSSFLRLDISGNLNGEAIKQSIDYLIPEATSNIKPATSEDLPIDVKMDFSFDKGKLTAKSENIVLGELRATIESKINFEADLLESITLKTNVQASSLNALLGLPVKSLNFNGHYSYQPDNWRVQSQGSVKSVNDPNLSIDNLHWNIDFNNQWQGEIKAKKVHYFNSTLVNPKLIIDGSSTQHKVSLTAKVQYPQLKKLLSNLDDVPSKQKENTNDLRLQPLSLQFLGSIGENIISTNKNKLKKWTVSNLKASLPANEETVLINAKKLVLASTDTQIENFCVATDGTQDTSDSICLNGKFDGINWSGDFEINHLDIKSVFELAKHYLASTDTQVEGFIDGSGKLSGSLSEVSDFELALKIPELRVKNTLNELVWKDLTFATDNHKQQPKLLIDWLSLDSNLILAERSSKINSLDGQIQILLQSNQDISTSLTQKNISWTLPQSPEIAESQILFIPIIELRSDLVKDKLNSQMKLIFQNHDYITSKVNTEWPLRLQSTMDGSLDIYLSDLSWLKKWQKNIDALDASLVQKSTFSGTWDQPQVLGKGQLKIDRLTIEEIGLDIKQSYINLTSENERLTIAGLVKNQAGVLNLNGNAKLYPERTADLSIEGNQITLVSDKNNTVIVSPTLKISYDDQILNVDGKIILDRANIKISALPSQAIKISEDQHIIGAPQKEKTGVLYNVHLQLVAGDNVHVEGFGLSSDINGNLIAQIQTGKAPLLNGRLNLKGGIFKAYKQELTIEEGQLLFLGSAENPGIQFRAVRMIEDVKVGIIADGSIASPRLTLFSKPPMAEENILSLLLTGRSIESLSQKEGNLLANTAIGLGVDGANKIAQKIGAALGIKNILISSKTQADSTQVNIGAKVSERLNLGYGTTINSKNEMKAGWIVEYKLTPRIFFGASSGDEVSAHISYKKQIREKKPKSQ